MYDENHVNTLADIEESFLDELEKVKFYSSVHSLTSYQNSRDHIYGIITDKQQLSTKLLHQLAAENAKIRSLRMPPEQNQIFSTTKDIKFKNQYIDENLRVPVLKGIKNQMIQNQINSSMQEDILEFKRQMEEAAKEAGEDAKKKGIKFIPYIISNVYTITFNRNNIISITILYYEYVGGKNYYIKTSYNYNLNTGRSLSIGDLFKPGVNYKALIDAEIRRQLAQNKEKYFPGTLEKFKGIAEDQPFYIEDNYLSVFFGFNEIAPVEAKIPIIRIPLALLKNSLRPELL